MAETIAHDENERTAYASLTEAVRKELPRLKSYAAKSKALAECSIRRTVREAAEDLGVSVDTADRVEKETSDEVLGAVDRLSPDEEKKEHPFIYAKKTPKYGIDRVSVSFTLRGKPMADSKVLFDSGNAVDVDIPNMDEVMDRISEIVGFLFEPTDFYCDFANMEDGEWPDLFAEKVLTSDSIQGSGPLSEYFGPNGKFFNYLYKVDGTAKLEPFKKDAQSLVGAKRDINVVSVFPTMNVCTRVVRSVDGGKPSPLLPEDFDATGVQLVQ